MTDSPIRPVSDEHRHVPADYEVDAASEMAALKSCPFCGGEAFCGHTTYSSPLPDTSWEDGSPITKAFKVNCISCGVSNGGVIAGFQTEAEAIAAWNQRSTPAGDGLADKVAGAIEWLEQMADRFEGEWPNTAKHCRLHVDILRTALSQPTEREIVEREIDRFTGRPIGDHGSASAAIRYALDCEDYLANKEAFLMAWRDGDLTEWPEYYSWLANVEPAAIRATAKGEK